MVENTTKETLTVGKLNNYITEMIDEPTHPDYFDDTYEMPQDVEDEFDEEAEDEWWEEKKAEVDADAYLSSVEAHEDPYHVPFEYGFGESILKKGSIVERLSGI